MEFWTQNEGIEIEIDIKPDPNDEAPFNVGPNIYLRIKNRNQRGVSTPFDKRSHGFIWFFSFLVWFNNVKAHLNNADESNIILLLDEPALSLHATAQADFLKYIDKLAENYQILFTTHSPFMINSGKLSQVRIIEDINKVGTTVSDNLTSADPRTLLPLQAALGRKIAQNLLMGNKNLLVDGPLELLYLKCISNILSFSNKEALCEEIAIVPVGTGLDNISIFVALSSGRQANIAILTDYHADTDQAINALIKQKIIAGKYIFNLSQFANNAQLTSNGNQATDIEDLLSTKTYLHYFNQAFAKALPANVAESDLPVGNRIIDRIEQYLRTHNIKLNPLNGFDRYLVATCFAASPPRELDPETLNNFETLFYIMNSAFSE